MVFSGLKRFISAKSARQRLSSRVQVEVLEDRCTPAHLFAASFFDSGLYQFNSDNGALEATLVHPYTSQLLFGPAGLTLGPDGNLYISSQFSDAILKYDRATNVLSTFISSDVLGPIAAGIDAPAFAPAGLRFSGNGDLYVSLNGGQSSTTGAVVRFNCAWQDGALAYITDSASVIGAGNMIQPTGMTFGIGADSGSLYVSSAGTDEIIRIANATTNAPMPGVFVTAGSGGMTYPTGLSWKDGNLYAVELGPLAPYQGEVLRFNATGAFDEIYSQPSDVMQFQFPSDLVFDDQGRMITANIGPHYPNDLAGQIYRYDANGVFDQTLTTSADFPNTAPGYSGIAPAQLALEQPISVKSVIVNGDFAAISAASEDGNVVTLTTNGNSGFSLGSQIVVAGFTDASVGYNGSWVITSVAGNQVQYIDANGGLTAVNNQTVPYAISQNTSSSLIGNQRSMVDSVAYNFSAPVNLASGAISMNIGAATTVGAASLAPNAPGTVLTSLNGGATWVVTWSSVTGNNIVGRSIADGVYTITLNSSNVTSVFDGAMMTTSRPADTFYRMFGDITGYANGIARVNNSDNLQYSNAYLKSTGASGYLAALDYNGQGSVTNTDGLQFSNRYLSIWNAFTPTI